MQLKSLKTGQLVKVGYCKYYILGVFYEFSIRSFYPATMENVRLAVIEQEKCDFSKILSVDAITNTDSVSCIFLTNKYIDTVKKWITKSLVASQDLRKNFGGIRDAENCTEHLHEIFTECSKQCRKFKSLPNKKFTKEDVTLCKAIKDNQFYLFETNSKRTIYLKRGNSSLSFPCLQYVVDSLAYDERLYIYNTYICDMLIVKDRQLIDIGINFDDMHLLKERLAILGIDF